MRTALWCLITLIFSSGAMMAGLNSGNIWIGYGLAFGAWALFAWRLNRNAKKAREHKFRQQQYLQLISRLQRTQH